jgi:hypothetical protein
MEEAVGQIWLVLSVIGGATEAEGRRDLTQHGGLHSAQAQLWLKERGVGDGISTGKDGTLHCKGTGPTLWTKYSQKETARP